LHTPDIREQKNLLKEDGKVKGKRRWLFISAVLILGVGLIGSGTLWGDEAGPPATGAASDGQTIVAQAAPAETTTTQPAAPPATTTTPGTGNVPVTEVTVKAQKEKPATGTVAEGYRVDTVKTIGPWPDMSLQDTPYSINIMSKELIENLQITNVNDLWKYNPYTELYIPESRFGNNMNLRGIYSGRVTQDGLPVTGMTNGPALEDKQQIEVMTGVVGFLYGVGSPAGVVNYVTKRAPDQPLADLTVGWTGRSQDYVHLDAGGPLNPNIGYRVNIMGQDGETYVKDAYVHEYLLSGALDFHILDNLKLETDFSRYFDEQDGMQIGFSPSTGGTLRSISPDLVNPYKLYGQPWGYERDQFTQGGGILTWNINDMFTFRSALREGIDETERLNVNSTNNWPARSYITTIYYIGESDTYNTATYGYLDTKFKIGPVSNLITTGVNFLKQDQLAYQTRTFNGNIPGTFYFADPAYVANPTPDIDIGRERPSYLSELTNLVIGDDIKLGEQWGALVGVNHAAIQTDSYTIATGAKSEYDKQATTPAVAFTYKPIPIVTTYVSYLEALEQGSTAPFTYLGHAVSNAGQEMPPSIDRQYEGGVKATLGGTLLTFAVFDMEQALQYTDPYTFTFVQSGRVDYRGEEITATGSPFDHFRIYGGVTHLNAVVVKDAANPSYVGKVEPTVADMMFKLVPEYDITRVPGLTLTGAILYRGRYNYNGLGQAYFTMPSATTFDLGFRYTTSIWDRPVIFRAMADNVFDRRYWNGSMPGDPLTFHLDMTFKFF
jgi:iron complex outermembrane receptor protein